MGSIEHTTALSVFIQCASFMFDASDKGAITRYIGKGATADTTGGYLASVQALLELLKAGTLQLLGTFL